MIIMKWTDKFKSKGDGDTKQLSVESQNEEFHHHIVAGNVLGHRYQCPMICEGDKNYSQPGNCPVCNMKLAAID
jgi:hypothetical protein